MVNASTRIISLIVGDTGITYNVGAVGGMCVKWVGLPSGGDVTGVAALARERNVTSDS